LSIFSYSFIQKYNILDAPEILYIPINVFFVIEHHEKVRKNGTKGTAKGTGTNDL